MEHDNQSPLFLTGFSRSGTTWLNRLFREYFDTGMINEGQFIVSFGRRLAGYGDLHRRHNRDRLLGELRSDPFFTIARRNYSVEMDWGRVASVGSSFPAMVMDILVQVTEQTHKTRVGSKYPVFGRYLGLLNSLFPTCRVVHIIRDGRDCALSQKQLVWGNQNTYAAAVHWRRYLAKARAGGSAMPGRYLEIRYEDLLSVPEATMAALETFVTGRAGPITGRFMTDVGALQRDKIARWRRAMRPEAQAVFEGVAGDTLRQLGYPLTGVARRPSPLLRGVYTAHNRLTREGWHLARQVFPSIPERKR